MKKLMLGLMMAFAVTAGAEMVDGIEYFFAEAAQISGYDKDNPPAKVDVDEVVDSRDGQKYLVTSVGFSAFDGCSSLISVSLSNAAMIEGWAFGGCENLTSVSLPKAMTIGGNAFDGCENLTSVSLPNATTIGECAFGGCENLTSVSLPNATTIGVNAFGGCENLTSVSLPNATTIGGNAFVNCPIVSIELGVTTVDEWLFSDMYSTLKEVSLPNATEIGRMAFCGFNSLTSVSLPNATTIEESAFLYSYSLSTLVVNAEMKAAIESKGKDYYGISSSCSIIVDAVTVVPHPAEHSTAKVYADGVEKPGDPIFVLSNATVDVVFEADCGYCFADDRSIIRTNTVQATDNPTTVTGPEVVKIPSMSEEVAQQAEWGGALMSGDLAISAADYANACVYYGLTPKPEPQPVQEGEVAVKQTELQAAKAETVSVANGVVSLGVTVNTNGNFTAETKDWKPVELTENNVAVKDGKVVISIPVSGDSGFMILQSGDAKVGD